MRSSRGQLRARLPALQHRDSLEGHGKECHGRETIDGKDKRCKLVGGRAKLEIRESPCN